MNFNNSELPINKLLDKINHYASNNEPLLLSVDEVKLLSESCGDSVFIPIYTNEQLVELCKRDKLQK
ncbi:hypothetical protein F896_01159 [Acinetobacter genomosp. 15BJ]|uniref:Uncharacterized protein n=1 Tax=Acinetobacter genomosp. 15BJ TaxID=106651 RepID=R9B2H3_9GAMM|nr:hypothetical protein [Acinetobacter genomosp. 15BJ]EOR08633.1 hypothetical protein F896_01159 [Acinetobacter genomosp. 15BJ]